MNKYVKFFITLILSILSLISTMNICNLNGNLFFINSFLCLLIFICFFWIIKNNLFTEKHNDKRLFFTCLIISIVLSCATVIGYNLTQYDRSYLERISVYLDILMLLPIILSCFIFLFRNLEKINKFAVISNNKIDKFLFVNRRRTFIICWLLIFIAWMPIFFAFFPGNFSYDSSAQIGEYLNHYLTNNNPLFHTFIVGFLIKLGKDIFGSYNIGVALYSIFQMLILSGTLAYVISYLNKKKAPFLLKIIFLIIFMFSPTNSILSITTTKDVLFAAVITILFTKLVDMATEPDKFFSSKKNLVLTIILSFLTFIFRHNAYYAFLFFSFFLIIFLKRYWKPLLIIILSSIIIYNFYLYEINSILKAENKAYTMNSLISIPMQQLGRTYNIANDLTAEERKLLNDLAIDERGFLNYQTHKSDSVIASTNVVMIYQNKRTYLELYLKLGLRHPIIYTDAFLANTMGYWYLGDKLPDSGTYRTYIEIRCRDDSHTTNNEIKFDSKIPSLFNVYHSLSENASYQNIPLLSLIMSVPFNIMLLFILTCIIIYRKKYHHLLPLLLLYGLLITLFLGPVALLRYSYSVFTTMPLIIYLAYYKKADD